MSFFCLVHGSTQNSDAWGLLVSELEQRGHKTLCVTLPADEPAASATRYAEVIGESLKDSYNAVVVAHSASGLFLPLVPNYAFVSRLVFLAAVIPQVGKSFLEQYQASPEMLCPDWVGKDPTRDDAVAMQFLFHDCSPDVARWALTTRRLMNAQRALTEVCPLGRWPTVPSSYILCLEDRTLSPQWWRRVAQERLGQAPVELPAGHCPHVSRPTELADVLAVISGS